MTSQIVAMTQRDVYPNRGELADTTKPSCSCGASSDAETRIHWHCPTCANTTDAAGRCRRKCEGRK